MRPWGEAVGVARGETWGVEVGGGLRVRAPKLTSGEGRCEKKKVQQRPSGL